MCWLPVRWSSTSTSYSPSAGKKYGTAAPPREPNGRCSFMRSSCTIHLWTRCWWKSGVRARPTTSRLILRAADRYRSMSRGEIERMSALLSNPWTSALSPGSSDRASTSRPSRSRTALTYSVRFRRWIAGRPGLGCAAAARSSAVSSQDANSALVAASGRGRPGGGIAPARSLRTTFSHTSAPPPTSARSAVSSSSPAVRRRAL